MRDDFFVLWRDHDGGAQRPWLRGFVLVVALLALGLGAALVAVQSTVNQQARFEYGTTRSYEGVLVGDPVPLLVTEERVYFLVDPQKHGFDPEALGHSNGRHVRLEATLIERDTQAMLEVVTGSVEDLGDHEGRALDLGPVRDDVVLRGEIVDSKCYLGVMNPGHLKPHRACAVNCLRGGIPPVLITRYDDGTTTQTVLVSRDDEELRAWILPYVAEPVQVRGRARRVGPLSVLEITRAGVDRLD